MKKKLYEKPTTKVYELKQQPTLLQSSVNSGNVNATIDDTPWTEEDI